MLPFTPQTGVLPISIATSIAVENFLGINPDFPQSDPIANKTHRLLINVRTLLRNVKSSISEQPNQIPEQDLIMHLETDINGIKNAVEANSRCKVSFYIPDYSKLNSSLPLAKVRAPKSEAQKFSATMEEAVLRGLLSNCPPEWKLEKDFMLVLPNEMLPNFAENVVLISHCAVDLLARYNFNDLKLLESHTGKLKSASLWSGKLAGTMDLSRIPFNKAMLQIFGDATHIQPMGIKIKRTILDIALADKWTPTTTKSLIMASLQKRKDPMLESMIYHLF